MVSKEPKFQIPGPAIVTAENTLCLAKAQYKTNLANPQYLSEFNQAFWYAGREAMGLSQADLVVPQAPYSEKDIREFMGIGFRIRKPSIPDFALYTPQVVSTAPEGLVRLGKRSPRLGSLAFQEGTSVLNVDEDGNLIELYGWMKTEKTIHAPHAKTNQQQAEEIVRKNHRVGHTLNIYAIASEQSKLLTDQYLDEVDTWVRILSTRCRGQVVHASYGQGGYCFVYSGLLPLNVPGGPRTRSVEVAKT